MNSLHYRCKESRCLLIVRMQGLALILVAAALSLSPAAEAALISFTVFDPTRVLASSATGISEMFAGTVTNNTGATVNATDLFFNFFGFDPSVVSLAQLLGNPDFTLIDGATSTPVDLFSFSLASNALIGQTYVANAFLQDANNNFSDVVTVSVTVVPEPLTLLLIGTGLAGIGIMRRNPTRRCSLS